MADAGCILQSLIDYLAPQNHIMPIDLGAKGRCALSLDYVEKVNLCPRLVATLVAMSLLMLVACGS